MGGALKMFGCLLLCVSCFPISIAAECGLPQIEVQESAAVSKRQIFLGDIARLDADEEWTARLKDVHVGTAPVAGNTRSLSVPQIETRLRQAGIHPSEVAFSGSERVEVLREQGQLLPEKEGEQPEAADSKEPTSGDDSVENGQAEESGAEPPQTIFVAARNIAPGEILSGEDLKTEEVNSHVNYRNVGTEADYLGMQAVRHIREGSRLATHAFQVPPTIERGDRIWIQVSVGGILVEAKGTARGSGEIGEYIRVVNESTNQQMEARVIDSDTVEVPLKEAGQP